jgi:hypothetical protein
MAEKEWQRVADHLGTELWPAIAAWGKRNPRNLVDCTKPPSLD